MKRCLGASILVFAVCDRTNAVYFLLGREKFFKRYRLDSEKWSDFGGRSKPGEADAETVAAREFFEETCGCVRYSSEDDLPLQGPGKIRESLLRKEYVYRFEFDVKNTGTPDGGVYTTFVRQVPLDPSNTALFSRVRRELAEATQTKPDFLEKTKLAWFGLQQVRNAAYSSPMLRCENYQREYVRRWFRDRVRIILPYMAV